MKSILQSIKPQYCELIASGKKTIEVRKTRPKLELPFKVYIYETVGRYKISFETTNPCISVPNGGKITPTENGYRVEYFARGNGKVIGEYVCDYITSIFSRSRFWVAEEILSASCLSFEEISKYADGALNLYGWHISDLKIYDKPKELSEFMIIDKDKLSRCPYRERIFQNPEFTNGNYLYGGYSCSKTKEPDFDDIDFCRGGCADVFKPLTRPPQSWCYVEEV